MISPFTFYIFYTDPDGVNKLISPSPQLPSQLITRILWKQVFIDINF